MKTIETKIAKNGATLYYVDGKRVSRDKANQARVDNIRESLSNIRNEIGTLFPIDEGIQEHFAGKKNKQALLVSRLFVEELNGYSEFAFFFDTANEALDALKKIAAHFSERLGTAYIMGDAKHYGNKRLANYCQGTLETELTTSEEIAENTEANIEDYAVTIEAQDAAIEAEIENAARNTESKPEPKGYIFTKTLIVTGCSRDSAHHSELEHIDTYCQILGDSEHFDGSIYRETVFFNSDHAHSWAVKTADGKVIISGTSKPDFNEIKAAVNSETPAHKVTKTERITAIENETPAEPEEITFIAQNGAMLTIEGGMPTIAANGNKLEVNGIWLGDYYTNEDAQKAAETLKCDVEECDDDHSVLSKDYFAELEFEESPTGAGKVVEHLNANAPENWSVVRIKDKLRVDYQGKRVADVSRITNRDLLAPHAFFQQFQPLVDKSKTDKQMFIDDRYRELAELEEMRAEYVNTLFRSDEPDGTYAAELKTLDEMINQVKRDIAEAEMDNPDTIESFCKAGAIDKNGNVWF